MEERELLSSSSLGGSTLISYITPSHLNRAPKIPLISFYFLSDYVCCLLVHSYKSDQLKCVKWQTCIWLAFIEQAIGSWNEERLPPWFVSSWMSSTYIADQKLFCGHRRETLKSTKQCRKKHLFQILNYIKSFPLTTASKEGHWVTGVHPKGHWGTHTTTSHSHTV